MKQYTYPAVFLENEKGGYKVVFQRSLNIKNVSGKTIEEAMEMAMDSLTLALQDYIENNKEVPKPEKKEMKKIISKEKTDNKNCKGFIDYVSIDYDFQIKELEKSKKKGVTIPASLNNRAKALKINFSRVLREELKKEIKKKEKEKKKVEK